LIGFSTLFLNVVPTTERFDMLVESAAVEVLLAILWLVVMTIVIERMSYGILIYYASSTLS